MAAAVLGGIFSRYHGRHERIRGEEEDEESGSAGLGGTPIQPGSGTTEEETSSDLGNYEGGAASSGSEAPSGPERSPARRRGGGENTNPGNGGDGEGEEQGGPSDEAAFGAAAAALASGETAEGDGASRRQQERLRTYLTQRRLADLEEERDLRRRRQSTCTLVAALILFRLWVQALAERDGGLMFLCIVGTWWTAKWVRAQRDQEDEMDRAMEAYVREAVAGGGGGEGGRTATFDAVALAGTTGLGPIEAADLRLMSFQAQLALTILESQRQMLENGGYGLPEGVNGGGVRDESRASWTNYLYREKGGVEDGGVVPYPSPSTLAGAERGGYGSVSSENVDDLRLEALEEGEGLRKLSKEDHDEGSFGVPSCSICLGEYEEGERLVRLPCDHVYHEECISAWADNHVRCPLCNYDLELGDHLNEVEEATSS